MQTNKDFQSFSGRVVSSSARGAILQQSGGARPGMSWFGGAAPEPEPEPQASPTLDRDPTSERASGALKALRQALSAAVTAAELEAALPGTDDFTLLRFLIAREFDVEAATAMVTDRVRWAARLASRRFSLSGAVARAASPRPRAREPPNPSSTRQCSACRCPARR